MSFISVIPSLTRWTNRLSALSSVHRLVQINVQRSMNSDIPKSKVLQSLPVLEISSNGEYSSQNIPIKEILKKGNNKLHLRKE